MLKNDVKQQNLFQHLKKKSTQHILLNKGKILSITSFIGIILNSMFIILVWYYDLVKGGRISIAGIRILSSSSILLIISIYTFRKYHRMHLYSKKDFFYTPLILLLTLITAFLAILLIFLPINFLYVLGKVLTSFQDNNSFRSYQIQTSFPYWFSLLIGVPLLAFLLQVIIENIGRKLDKLQKIDDSIIGFSFTTNGTNERSNFILYFSFASFFFHLIICSSVFPGIIGYDIPYYLIEVQNLDLSDTIITERYPVFLSLWILWKFTPLNLIDASTIFISLFSSTFILIYYLTLKKHTLLSFQQMKYSSVFILFSSIIIEASFSHLSELLAFNTLLFGIFLFPKNGQSRYRILLSTFLFLVSTWIHPLTGFLIVLVGFTSISSRRVIFNKRQLREIMKSFMKNYIPQSVIITLFLFFLIFINQYWLSYPITDPFLLELQHLIGIEIFSSEIYVTISTIFQLNFFLIADGIEKFEFLHKSLNIDFLEEFGLSLIAEFFFIIYQIGTVLIFTIFLYKRDNSISWLSFKKQYKYSIIIISILVCSFFHTWFFPRRMLPFLLILLAPSAGIGLTIILNSSKGFLTKNRSNMIFLERIFILILVVFPGLFMFCEKESSPAIPQTVAKGLIHVSKELRCDQIRNIQIFGINNPASVLYYLNLLYEIEDITYFQIHTEPSLLILHNYDDLNISISDYILIFQRGKTKIFLSV